LINAGVMEQPIAGVFTNGWPAALHSLPTWQQYFTAAREILGSTINGVPNTIVHPTDALPRKYVAFRAIDPANVHPAPITVAMNNTTSRGNVVLNKCKRCGDCATGCNFGAKNSLDVNLLASAHQRGAEIYSGATVLHVERGTSGIWIVHCVHTNGKLRDRAGAVTEIRARHVVLAAGAGPQRSFCARSTRDHAVRTSWATLFDQR
jgi:ferredoxin